MKTLLLELSCDSFGEMLIVLVILVIVVIIITVLIFLIQGLYIILVVLLLCRPGSTHLTEIGLRLPPECWD